MKQDLIKLLKEYINTFRVKSDAGVILGISMCQLYGVLKGTRPIKLERLIELCELAGYTITLEISK